MQKDVPPAAAGTLDEFQLRDELRALRTQIPDSPALNPIVSLAFDLSRRLEAGDITFAELKALAGRLMDRACVKRARHLRERVGFVDRGTTYKEFADYVEGAAAAADFEAFKKRWERARTGIVLTAHPTFGLSDALSKRIVEIAVADDVDPNTRIGVPHRPDEDIDLAYEHGRAQNAIQNLRNAYVELLDSFFSAAVHASATRRTRCAPSWRRSLRGSATTSTGAPTSIGASRSSSACRRSAPRSPTSASASSACATICRPTARCSASRARSPASSTWRSRPSTSRSKRSTR